MRRSAASADFANEPVARLIGQELQRLIAMRHLLAQIARQLVGDLRREIVDDACEFRVFGGLAHQRLDIERVGSRKTRAGGAAARASRL